MNLKYRVSLAAALAILGGAAAAQITSDGVIQDLSAQGYSRIEVANGPTQMKVEAIRGTEKLEVVYDSATGNVLKSETATIADSDNTMPGIQVRTRSRDFVTARNSDSSGVDDDSDDDNSGSDDDGSDDHGGKGHDGDHGGEGGGDHGGGSDD